MIFRQTAAWYLAFCCGAVMATARCQEPVEAAPQVSTEKLPASARMRLPGMQPNDTVLLPNGWSLAPQGTQIPMGDFPVNIQVCPSGEFVAILHAGYGTHEIRIVSLVSKKVVSSAQIDQAFFGMSFTDDGKWLAVSGGEDEKIYVFPFDGGFLAKPQIVNVAEKADNFVVSGVTPLNNGEQWLVCGLLASELRIVPTTPTAVGKSIAFDKDSYPYASIVDREKNLAYVSLWGNSQVAVVDLTNGKLVRTLQTDSHPTEMILLDQGRWLYVACSNNNSVVLLDTESGQQREVLTTSLYSSAPNGSTPSSISVSPDGKVLLVANADNNNVALFDISDRGHSTSLGFIPVGWYPTSVRFDPLGETILVANGKGMTSRSNVHGPNPNQNPPGGVREYIGGLFQGTLSVIPSPSPEAMAEMTRTAVSCSPTNELNSVPTIELAEGHPIPKQVGEPSPIKHCVYIIKENRTYDQVFGDLPQGNGDSSLCIFPRSVTPNHHALAEQFVLLDNFYVESEVSADGHEWTMAAYATDYVEKTWPLTYRGGRKKLSYPSEGKFKIAEPSSGYLWDRCREKGVSYFSFGEFVENSPKIGTPATTKIEALQGHFDPMYRSYDLDYPDMKRAERFLSQWNEMSDAGTLPQMIVLRLPNDHTYGTRIGKPTPTAMVAENDVALGHIIAGLSRSDKWKETAVFVVEDDAQNGADHVDAHRTVALAISPYTRSAGVDSTMYSTSSMLRTMELILGLEPMTQFDAAAEPMYRSFTAVPNFAPYDALPANVDINAKNGANAWGADLSEKLDLSREDAADDLLFGDIIWRSVKGANHPMPAPVRSALVFAEVEHDEDAND
jgi:DNA-binding beta-propeller fold protein YncE